MATLAGEPNLLLVAPLRAVAGGQHPLEIGGLLGAAPVLALLVRGQRGVDGLVLLGGPLVLGAAQLLGCGFALAHFAQTTPAPPVLRP